MKILIKFLPFTLAACFLGGCVSPDTVEQAQPATTNAVTGIVTPATPAVVQYVVSPGLTNTLAQIQGGYNALAPTVSSLVPAAAPFISAGGTIFGAVAGILTTLSALYAGYKNSQANTATASAAQHSAAAAALASVVATNPTTVTAALDAAKTNGSTATVATHLASAQSPT